MASETAGYSVTNTLSTTTVDTITLNRIGGVLAVTNQDNTVALAFTLDGITPVLAGNDCYQVPPGMTMLVNNPPGQPVVVKLIGNGNVYNVQSLKAGSSMLQGYSA